MINYLVGIEQKILIGVMCENYSFGTICTQLRSDHFSPANRVIFDCIAELYAFHPKVDFGRVNDVLLKGELDSLRYIDMSNAATLDNIDGLVQALLNNADDRRYEHYRHAQYNEQK